MFGVKEFPIAFINDETKLGIVFATDKYPIFNAPNNKLVIVKSNPVISI